MIRGDKFRGDLASISRGSRGEFGATPRENVTSEKTTIPEHAHYPASRVGGFHIKGE